MPRIFIFLVSAHLAVLLGTAALGLVSLGDTPQRHVVLAVFTLLLACLIQVVLFTYLSVAGRMITQALHLGKLDSQAFGELRRLKRSAAQLVGLVVLSVVFVTATGALHWREQDHTLIHTTAAFMTLVTHAFVYWRQYGVVSRAAALWDQTMSRYAQRKKASAPRP